MTDDNKKDDAKPENLEESVQAGQSEHEQSDNRIGDRLEKIRVQVRAKRNECQVQVEALELKIELQSTTLLLFIMVPVMALAFFMIVSSIGFALGVQSSFERAVTSIIALAFVGLSMGFVFAFPRIWRLRDLYRQRQILQIRIEDYFRKEMLLNFILACDDDKEMRRALLMESHRHFANRSAAEFLAALAGKIKPDDDTGHPVIDTAKRVVDKAEKNGG